MSDICPNCKKEDQGFVVNGQVGGSVTRIFDSNGKYEETNLDKMYWKTASSVVRCANCNRIRRDWIFDERNGRCERR